MDEHQKGQLLGKLYSKLDEISDKDLSCGCIEFLKAYENKFTTYPASIRFHNTQNGGLLEHTYEVIKLSLEIADAVKVPINRSYLIAAAFLHDFGKINDYEPDVGNKYQTDKGLEQVFKYMTSRTFDHSLFPIVFYPVVTGKALPLEVSHAILAHMGGWSKTSVFPETHLDAILCSADLISTRIE
jgi:putative nucleotidyltransferase with HDIG domain